MAHMSGKLTKKLVENLGAGRNRDDSGLYLVVDPSGARRWIVRVCAKFELAKLRLSRCKGIILRSSPWGVSESLCMGSGPCG